MTLKKVCNVLYVNPHIKWSWLSLYPSKVDPSVPTNLFSLVCIEPLSIDSKGTQTTSSASLLGTNLKSFLMENTWVAVSNVDRRQRGTAWCSDRLPIRFSCSSCKPVSSKVSRIAVSARLRSKVSLWPPGNAMSPDQGSPDFWARFINNI